MGIPVDMVPPKTEHNNDKNKNNEDREEGEIVDDFEDIISSDEEFSMRERIKELEARNLELEKIASISGIYSYGYTKERYKSPISPPDLSKDDYYVSAPKTKHNRPNPKASSKQTTTAIKRSKSSTRQHVKSGRRRSVSPPPKTMPLVSSRTRNRKRKYQKISRSRSSKRTAKSKKKTDLIDISSSEDELCALNRDELKKALKRDVKTFHHTKKNAKNTTMQKSAICDNIVSIIDLVDDEDEDDNKDELSDDSVTLEEQELRLIALKSAVFKKHLDRKRKKENEEAKPYSPSEFVELFGTFRGSPSSKNSIESGPMDISPITSPEYISDNNNKPIDMDLVNSSDSECPIFAGQTDNWIPIDQIPLPNNNQKIPLQSPIPIKVTLAADSNDVESNYENDERVKIITVSNSPEPADEEELALRALLLAKMNSPKVSKNNNKPKDDVQVESNQFSRNFDDRNDYIKIDEPINNDSDTSLNAEILRNILLISLDKKPFSKTEQVLKEAVKRLKNQTQINKNDLFVSEGSDLQENSNSNDFNNPFPSDMDYRIQNNSTNCSVDQDEVTESDKALLDAKEYRRNDKGMSDNFMEQLPSISSNLNIENNKKETNDLLQSQIGQVDPVIPQLQILQLENIPIIKEDLNAKKKINVNIQISQARSSETKINKNDLYEGEGSDLQENSDSSGCNNPFPSDIDYRIKSNSTNCSVEKSKVMIIDKALLDGKEANSNISDNFVEQISLKSSNYNIENNKENKVVQSQIDQVSVIPQKIKLFAQDPVDLEENSPIIQENLNIENENNLIIKKLQAGPSGDLVPNTNLIDVETTKEKGNLNVRAVRITPANISKTTNKILAKSKIIKSTTKYASKLSHHISQQKRKALMKVGADSMLPDNFKSISNSPVEDVFKKKTSRLITVADVPTVKQIIIHLGESESDTDDFESAFTTATTPTTFEDYCDKTSTKDVKLASPCDSPQNVLSPAAVVPIDDTTGDSEVIEEKSSTKKCIVNDVFQARLNEFLKNARTKVEMIKKDPETSSTTTPLAVRHLPPSSQLEYKRLVNRMKILEKQKQAKNDKITGNIENFKVTIKNDVIKNKTDSAQITNIKRTIINDGVPTSVITFNEINPKDPLIKKVLIKNASNPQIPYSADMKEISHSKENTVIYPTTSKNARLKRRSISEGTQTERSIQLQDNTAISTVPSLDNIDLLQNYETDFTKNSSSLLENISKTINLVHIAKGEKLKKFALQSKLEQLKKQMESVEMEISNQTDRILKIYPKISESHKVIVNLKQKCMKLDKLSANLGKAVKGKIYKTNDSVKRAIAEKSKLLSDEIKSLKGLKLNDYIKSLSAENDMRSLNNSPQIGVSSNEIAIEGCNVNVSNCDVTEKIDNSNSDIKDCDKETGITDSVNIATAPCSKTDATEESTILNETSLNITSTNSAMETDINALPEISSNKLSEQNPLCEYKSMEDDTKDLKAEIVPESSQDKTELKQCERNILDTSLKTEESASVQNLAIGNTATMFNITDNIGNYVDTDMISISEENTLETLTSPNPCYDICIRNSPKEIEVNDVSLLSENSNPKIEKIDISMSPKRHNDDHGNNSSDVMFEITSLKINDKNVISRDQSVYDDNTITFVEEVLIDDKNISNEEKCIQIKEYVSPLEYIRDSRLINPNGIICPYQLRGQCDDKDCKFEHLPNDDGNKT